MKNFTLTQQAIIWSKISNADEPHLDLFLPKNKSMKTKKYSHLRSILFGDVKDVYHSVQFLCECMTLDPPS